ncbi:hypothetical protein VP1G_01385 [Cytospora mali]|uniref:Uncharacterized protein n=1 Tax=Cytospora mali TaxID=578113 RepID=A0A194UQV2_CYTMA|nr:hypothetical protein VP1G_01385 [Valsa mali var. pyri (nom. inval.)]
MASEGPSSSAAAPAPAPASTDAPAPTEASASASAPTETTKAPAKASAKAPAKAKTKTKAKAKAASVHPDDDPSLWIYTSLTAGNMHIVTATSRLETILRANRVPFKAVDIADMVEIEEWNEYGELKQHVKIYYDEFTQPAKGSIAPVPKYKQPEDKAPHPPAALNPPPAPEREKSAAEEHANKLAQAIRDSGRSAQNKGVAEEAAQKAKQMEQQAKQARLQALREKARAAKKEAEGPAAEEGDDAKNEAAASTSAEPPTKEMSQLSVATTAESTASGVGAGPGLQSPTSGAWKESGNGANIGEALRTVQSPTTTSWVPPADSSLAEGAESFAGARVASVSADEIAKVESQTMIKEEPEEEAVEDEEA